MPELITRSAPPHHPLGVSTGYRQDLGTDWGTLIEHAAGMSPFAAELAALAQPELGPLVDFLAEGADLPFLYLSVHAPVKGELEDEEDQVRRLAALPPSVDAIVVHPDRISEPALYRAVGRRLVIENMDRRKARGATRADLEALFHELPEAGFCFDIAHAWDVDRDMSLAEDLLDAFRSRLRHVHLSSLRDGSHVSLTVEDELLFAPHLARCRDVPWILEAPPPAHWQRVAGDRLAS